MNVPESPVANTAGTQQPIASGSRRAFAFFLDLVAFTMLRFGLAEAVPSLAGANVAADTASWLLAFAYFALIPLAPWQGTPGKWICGIRICDRAGQRLTLARSAIRSGSMLGWVWLAGSAGDYVPGDMFSATKTLTWLLFPLAWAPAWMSPRRQTLFDLLAGSLVVRKRATAQEVATLQVPGKPGIIRIVGVVIVFLAIGTVFGTLEGASRDRDRRVRVAYALTQVAPVRENIAAFHAREKRWPTPAELGIAEWTRYPDGGGYRVQPDGSIRITFTVLPELKGHSLRIRPVLDKDGNLNWHCSADEALKRLVLASCRQ